MFETSLLEGQLVRLAEPDPEKMAEIFTRWANHSDYWRLMDADPARPISKKANQDWLEKYIEEEAGKTNPEGLIFSVRTLDQDHLIGDIGLDGISWPHGDAFVGIAIGDRDYWGRGYGTDAMQVLLRYAFTELNLYRISLDVFEYNPRAIRSYEKVGFKVEGRARKFLKREGRYWDMLYMGLLRPEWERIQEECKHVVFESN